MSHYFSRKTINNASSWTNAWMKTVGGGMPDRVTGRLQARRRCEAHLQSPRRQLIRDILLSLERQIIRVGGSSRYVQTLRSEALEFRRRQARPVPIRCSTFACSLRSRGVLTSTRTNSLRSKLQVALTFLLYLFCYASRYNNMCRYIAE